MYGLFSSLGVSGSNFNSRQSGQAEFQAQQQAAIFDMPPPGCFGLMPQGGFGVTPQRPTPIARIGKVTPKPGVIRYMNSDYKVDYRWKVFSDYKWYERVVIWFNT